MNTMLYIRQVNNVNADALSRNPVNLEEADCNVNGHKTLLNLNDPKDAEKISQILEESDEDEEDEDFNLYLSDNEELENLLPGNDTPEKNTDSIPFTHRIM